MISSATAMKELLPVGAGGVGAPSVPVGAKRRRRKKDPNAPKRPKSAYMCFLVSSKSTISAAPSGDCTFNTVRPINSADNGALESTLSSSSFKSMLQALKVETIDKVKRSGSKLTLEGNNSIEDRVVEILRMIS